MKEEVNFKLFIAGNSARGALALAKVKAACAARYGEHYRLTVIDVLEQPEIAEEEKILVTPTLVKILPRPHERALGLFRDATHALGHKR